MRTKKVGIDARLLYQTGVGVYLRNLLYHLSTLKDKQYEIYVFAKENDWKKFLSEYNVKEVSLRFVKCDTRWHSFAEQLTFLLQLIRYEFDLVHFPYFSWPILYFRPFVATIHDTILLTHPTGKASTLPFFIYQAKQFVFRIVFGEQVRRASKILVPSEAVKNELANHFPSSIEKTIVTTEGVDKVFMQSICKKPIAFPFPNYSYYLYVGNCYPHKNVELLLSAFGKINGEGAKLVVVGPKSIFVDRLREAQSDSEESILWLHDVATGELKWLYQNAKALVFPSKSEGFGLPILEALSVGCPVMASDIPVFREVAGGRAKYFSLEDPAALTTMLSTDSSHDNPRHNVEVADFTQLSKKTENVYSSLLS